MFKWLFGPRLKYLGIITFGDVRLGNGHESGFEFYARPVEAKAKSIASPAAYPAKGVNNGIARFQPTLFPHVGVDLINQGTAELCGVGIEFLGWVIPKLSLVFIFFL